MAKPEPTIRNADIEALRSAQIDRGRPIKSQRIFDKNRTYEYKVNKKGRVEIVDDHTT